MVNFFMALFHHHNNYYNINNNNNTTFYPKKTKQASKNHSFLFLCILVGLYFASTVVVSADAFAAMGGGNRFKSRRKVSSSSSSSRNGNNNNNKGKTLTFKGTASVSATSTKLSNNIYWPAVPTSESKRNKNNKSKDRDYDNVNNKNNRYDGDKNDNDTNNNEDDDYEYDDDDDDDDEEYNSSVAAMQRIFDSILIVHCTHREPDYKIPWQNVHQYTSSSSGFVIDEHQIGKRIMTNAHSVEYGSIVQVQRRGDSQKYLATVEAIGQECDLALLNVENEEFWNSFGNDDDDNDNNDDDNDNNNNAIGLKFGSLPELQDDVEVLGYPTGGDSLSVTSGVVSRIEMQEYAQAGVHLLAMQIDAAINSGNSGGPVVDMDGNVVGVAFQSLDSAENIGYVVPVPVVQHFLEDLRRNSGQYTGFTSFGMRFAVLENEALRRSLGMKSHHSGVLVRKVSPLSPAKDAIFPNDVIMEIDGISVANDGKVPFRPGERVSMICYLQTKFTGDKIQLKILRNGKEVEEMAPVCILKDLVPSHWNSQPPPYIVTGGLVFSALSIPFLNACEAYEEYVSDDLCHLIGLVHNSKEQEEDEVVMLCQVLAHQCNLGYEHFSDLHLTHLNGKPVRSLHHLHSLLKECNDDDKEEFVKFEFAPGGRIIVLERAIMNDATEAVCEEHSIRQPFRLLS